MLWPEARRVTTLAVMCFLGCAAGRAEGAGEQPAGRYFTIRVVDDATGRGVPLVRLRTVHDVSYYTDSNGIVAFHEPGLTGKKVFFHVESDGYEFPKDGFGSRGRALDVQPGAEATLRIQRLNIAERLYRVTGGGIYRDSVLVGVPVPLKKPVLNGDVLGCDSVLTAVYRGRLYWFWGDTSRPGYPMGNFDASGATSSLPGSGGLDPDLGVDFEYFVDQTGFARRMAPVPGKGPTWLGGACVLREADGRERLITTYSKIESPMRTYERGWAEFDDEAAEFRRVKTYPVDAPAQPRGHPFRVDGGQREWFYFGSPLPLTRVEAGIDRQLDIDAYEAFTCATPDPTSSEPGVERGPDGAVRYRWRNGVAPSFQREQDDLKRRDLLAETETLVNPRDAETGKPWLLHSGSTYWSPYRQRWVVICGENFGTSLLGETWYAEGDTPVGPWVYARKIVSHEKYSFYNPKQHPEFAKEDGRIIYFEGTYTKWLSGAEATPRYDYNQIMYKIDLDDPRLILPVAVYDLAPPGRPQRLGTCEIARREGITRPCEVVFFTPDRPGPGTVPVYGTASAGEGSRLRIGMHGNPAAESAPPLFHAIRAGAAVSPAAVVALYEFRSANGDARAYGTSDEAPAGFTRSQEPLCFVWPSPTRLRFTPGAPPGSEEVWGPPAGDKKAAPRS